MRDASYLNPRHPQKLSSVKIAVVIPAYIMNGQKKDYGHFIENKLDTIKRTLAAHEHFNAGLPYEILLYDNSSLDAEGAEFLASKGATVRKNFGYGFGAWKDAWETHRDAFDFYLFTEDDIAPSRDGWLEEILTRFLTSGPDVGAVGSFLEARGPGESLSDVVWELMQHEHPMLYNFDGAFTFTSARVLAQVDTIGGLPVFNVGPRQYHPPVNECVFQQPIMQLGYRLVSFDDGKYCVVHGSEIYTGDIENKGKILGPLVNINGRHNIPAVAKAFEWYK